MLHRESEGRACPPWEGKDAARRLIWAITYLTHQKWYNGGMETPANPPKTLLEAIRYFSDLDVATEYVAETRWPEGPVCPRCGLVDEKHYYLKTRRVWKCRSCKKQFSVKVGTIFEDTPLGLDKWLAAMWLIANCKNGISSYELARDLGIQQKSRGSCSTASGSRCRRARSRSCPVRSKRTKPTSAARPATCTRTSGRRRYTGRGASGKVAVMGLAGAAREVRTKVVPDTKSRTFQVEVRENVEPGSEVHTDASSLTGAWPPSTSTTSWTTPKVRQGSRPHQRARELLEPLQALHAGNLCERGAVPSIPVPGRTGVQVQRARG